MAAPLLVPFFLRLLRLPLLGLYPSIFRPPSAGSEASLTNPCLHVPQRPSSGCLSLGCRHRKQGARTRERRRRRESHAGVELSRAIAKRYLSAGGESADPTGTTTSSLSLVFRLLAGRL
ncbi:hypothetical protein BO70DRAFT_358639 [Aspergillus heteromorphus CBS 117.55]|uniref:Secreted protein n=1 Tax=Aspergillus heteromorphus CBS 117.55 TaxID=1448321 RepID=A0A317WXX2_9EURO|nr:uncharacterized protein BO70DRAFT_358639 [Aspergillus heteromorphus CBS 117.55]PWY91199.1 hypothetical protein BO70DRAFT_358639 [Aspergillus heteromorphus CBS 117.55]